MYIKQISVFVENQPGRLAEITKLLGEAQVDIRALSIADTTDFGILRLIVNKPDVAEKVLRESGFTVSLTNVIAIGVEDSPGGLSGIMQLLYENGIGVEYMYAFISKSHNTAYVILRVNKDERALEVLSQNKISILTGKDIYEM